MDPDSTKRYFANLGDINPDYVRPVLDVSAKPKRRKNLAKRKQMRIERRARKRRRGW